MPWSAVRFNPGINRERTRYGGNAQWYDGSLVRFRDGLPEKWAGWVRYFETILLDGICRSLHRWAILEGLVYTGIGTNRRFYVASDDQFHDVSPIFKTAAAQVNVLSTTAGSDQVKVTQVAHGVFPGQIIVISGAVDIGGISAANINGERIVSTYIDDDNYTFTAGAAATSTVALAGGTITIQYVFQSGSESQFFGGGWGNETWGEKTWGGDGTGSGTGNGSGTMGAWSQDNWGEDLVACSYDGPIFYWDATNPAARMINIRDLPGADGFAPTLARFIVVSHRDRHLIAFGVGEEYAGTIYAPMTIRWCSQEDIFNWNEADLAGTAGSIPLSQGSRFIAIEPTLRETLVWSDTAMYSLQFVGAPDVYVAEQIASEVDIAGMNAAKTFGNATYWMGRSGFYVYDGRVTKLPCSVWEHIDANMDWTQANKVYAASNRANDEIVFFWPSMASSECDSYAAIDVVQGIWTIGSLSRTAWLDMDFQTQPFATSRQGMMFWHEIGADDGSTNPPSPISAFIESTPFELSSEGSYDKGDRFMFIRRCLPDVTFREFDDQVHQPQMRMVLKMMDKPGGGFKSGSSSQYNSTVIIPVEEFTEEVQVRLRGRSLTVRYESDTIGTLWRVGIPRLDMRPDGQR